jgi:hypothetical protein
MLRFALDRPVQGFAQHDRLLLACFTCLCDAALVAFLELEAARRRKVR